MASDAQVALDTPLLNDPEPQAALAAGFKRHKTLLALPFLASACGCFLILASSQPQMASQELPPAVSELAAEPKLATQGVSAPPPPFYRVRAKGLRDAGRKHGEVAKERIHGWFNSNTMKGIFAFQQDEVGGGKQAFEALKKRNTEEFPEYVEEMEGIAEGAGVTIDQVWGANLMNEISNLQAMKTKTNSEFGPPKDLKHAELACSDLYAISPGGYKDGFACGHNEDWSIGAKHFLYYIAFSFEEDERNEEDGTAFTSCAGMTYPAHIIGSPPSFNVHGLYGTHNQLTSLNSRPNGLALAFVKRRALCESRTFDEFVEKITVPGWSTGASLNFADTNSRRMAQVEVWQDRSSVLEITESMGNYSHFNEYKRLHDAEGNRLDDWHTFVKDLRQPRTDSLPPPHSAADIARGLSDYLVFSDKGTIATVILDGSAKTVSVWCCGTPSATGPPLYKWDITNFF